MEEEDLHEDSEQIQLVNFVPRMIKKDSLFVTFNGLI